MDKLTENFFAEEIAFWEKVAKRAEQLTRGMLPDGAVQAARASGALEALRLVQAQILLAHRPVQTRVCPECREPQYDGECGHDGDGPCWLHTHSNMHHCSG